MAAENRLGVSRPYELQHPNSALVRVAHEKETQLILHVPGGKLQALAGGNGMLMEGFVHRPSDLDKLLGYFKDIKVARNVRAKAAPAAFCGGSPFGELRRSWLGSRLDEWMKKERDGVLECAKALAHISQMILEEIQSASAEVKEPGAYASLVLEENGWLEESPLILQYCIPYHQKLRRQQEKGLYLLCQPEMEGYFRQAWDGSLVFPCQEASEGGVVSVTLS